MLGRMVAWLLVGFAAIVALKMVLGLAGAILGTVFGLGLFLMFKVLPLLVLAWLGYKAWQMLVRPAPGLD